MARRKGARRRLSKLNTRRLETSHAARLQMHLTPLRDHIERLLEPSLESFVSEARADDITDVISAVFGRIRVSFAAQFSPKLLERDITRSAEQIASAGGDVHRAQLKTVLGVDPVQAEPWIEREVNTFVKENASLISTLPDEAISNIEQMIFREGRRKSSVQEIRRKIQDELGATENRARLIAQDQVLKFNSKLTELRQTGAGVDEYIWRDSDDGKVRPRHHFLNGKKFKWSEPPVTVTSGKRAGERNHPGQDIHCRCWAEPVLDNLIPGI